MPRLLLLRGAFLYKQPRYSHSHACRVRRCSPRVSASEPTPEIRKCIRPNNEINSDVSEPANTHTPLRAHIAPVLVLVAVTGFTYVHTRVCADACRDTEITQLISAQVEQMITAMQVRNKCYGNPLLSQQKLKGLSPS